MYADGLVMHVSMSIFADHVNAGRAEWLDKNHRKCLILWRRIEDWADLLLDFVRHLSQHSNFNFAIDDCGLDPVEDWCLSKSP